MDHVRMAGRLVDGPRCGVWWPEGKSWVNLNIQLSGTKQVCINGIGPNIACIHQNVSKRKSDTT